MVHKLTLRDPNQIQQHQHDEELDACRVTVVGIDGLKEGIQESLKGLKIEFPQDKIGKDIQVIEIPQVFKEIEIKEVPQIVEKVKIERIEIPVIIKEVEIKTVEKPILTEVVKVIEIEKPVVITEFKHLPKWIFLSQMAFVLLNLGLLITLILK